MYWYHRSNGWYTGYFQGSTVRGSPWAKAEMRIDPLFFAAVTALGWGLSLVTYRPLARRFGWPLGVPQTGYRIAPLIIGLLGIASGIGHGLARIGEPGVAALVVMGLAFAVFWLGFMRVAAQTALLLTPVAASLLILAEIARLLS